MPRFTSPKLLLVRARLVCLALVSAAAIFSPAYFPAASMAAPLYWDANGVAANTGTTATGTWGTSVFWNTDSTGTGGALQAGTTIADDVFFSSGTNYTGTSNVTISGAQAANSITFEEGNVVIAGGTSLTLGAGGITLYSNANNSISTQVLLADSQAFTNNSSSTLTVGAMRAVDGSGNNYVLQVAGIAGNATLNSTIANALVGTNTLGLNITAAGNTTLSGTNTFTGGVILNNGGNGGTLVLGSATALGAASSVFTIQGGQLNVSGGITISNNNAQIWSGDFTYVGGNTLNLGTGTVDLSGGTRTVNVNASTLTVGGTVSNGAISKTGAGTLVLTGSNSFVGDLTVFQGTLQGTNTAGTNLLNAFGTSTINLNGGTLAMRASATGSTQTLAVGNNVALGGNATINVNNNGSNASNLFAMGTLQLGNSTLTVAAGNDYGVTFTGVTAVGNAAIQTNDSAAQFRSTTLTLEDSASVGTSTITLGGPGQSNSKHSTFTGVISDNTNDSNKKLAIKKEGAGTWILSGNNTYTGGTTLTTGTLDLNTNGVSGITGTITVNGGTLIGRNSNGAETQMKAFGTANLVLNGGTVQLRANSTGGSTIAVGNNVAVTSNVTFDLNNNGSQSSRTYAMGTLAINGSTLTVNSGNSYGLSFTDVTVSGNATFSPGNDGLTLATLTVADSVAANSTTTVTLAGAANTKNITGLISDNINDATKKLALLKSGGTDWRLQGTNSYTGGTTINGGSITAANPAATNVLQALGGGAVTLNAGTLNLRANGTASNQTIAVGNNVIVNNSATIDVNNNGANSGGTFVMGSLNAGNASNITTLTINTNNSYAATFTGTTLNGSTILNLNGNTNSFGAISQSVQSTLGKIGAGTLNLNLSASHTGGTIVGDGTLNVATAVAIGADVAGNDLVISGPGRVTLNSASSIGANQKVRFDYGNTISNNVLPALPLSSTNNGNGALPMLAIMYDGLVPTIDAASNIGVIGLGVNDYNQMLDQAALANAYIGAVDGARNYNNSFLGAGSDGVYRLGAGGNTLTITLATLSSTNSLVVGASPYNNAAMSNASGTVNLQTSSDYTGSTLVNSGSTLVLQGGSGTILNTSSMTVFGTLTLNNNSPGTALGNNNNRIANSLDIVLKKGAVLNLTSNASTDTTESIGTLVIDSGNPTVSIGSQASRVTTLNASDFSRVDRATALIRGSSLNQTVATNVSKLLLNDGGASLSLVGTVQLANGATNDSTKTLKIVPYLIGGNSTSDSGSNFVTYDSGLGFRLLTSSQQTVLTAGYASPVDAENVVAFNGTITTSGPTVNSLLFNGSQALNGSGVLTVNSGAIASVSSSSSIGSGFTGITLGNGEGVITVTQNTLTISAPISVTSSGGLTKAGGGTLTLSAANQSTGELVVNAGTLNLNAASSHSAIKINGGTLSTTTVGALSGSSATVTINAGGVLAIGATNVALGGGRIYLNDGGRINLTDGTAGLNYFGTNNVIEVTGHGFINGSQSGGSGNKYNIGEIQLNNNSILTINRSNSSNNSLGTGVLTLNGNATLNAITQHSAFNHFVHITKITGTGNFTKIGNNDLLVSSTNSSYIPGAASDYVGNTYIEQGRLRLGRDNALPTSTTVAINGGATLDLSAGGGFDGGITRANFNQEIAGLNNGSSNTGGTVTANGTSETHTASRTLTLSGSGNYNFAGTIVDNLSGSGSTLVLVKNGQGSQALGGINTYTGTTTVNAGKLLINGQLTASATTVNAGTLGGSGTIALGTVIGDFNDNGFNYDAILSPGNSIGTLTTGDLTLNHDSLFEVEVSTSTVTADKVIVNGNLTIGGGDISFATLGSVTGLANGTKFTLIDYSGTWNGNTFNGFANGGTFNLGLNEYQIRYDDGASFNDLTITVINSAVPEPSTYLLGLLGICGVLLGKRLRRQVA